MSILTLSPYIICDEFQYTGLIRALLSCVFSCCAGKVESCNHWKATATESKDGVIKMDFCHLSGNVCNPDGRLIRLDMAGMGLTCNYPTGAFEKLKAVEKINLAQNNLTVGTAVYWIVAQLCVTMVAVGMVHSITLIFSQE